MNLNDVEEMVQCKMCKKFVSKKDIFKIENKTLISMFSNKTNYKLVCKECVKNE